MVGQAGKAPVLNCLKRASDIACNSRAGRVFATARSRKPQMQTRSPDRFCSLFRRIGADRRASGACRRGLSDAAHTPDRAFSAGRGNRHHGPARRIASHRKARRPDRGRQSRRRGRHTRHRTRRQSESRRSYAAHRLGQHDQHQSQPLYQAAVRYGQGPRAGVADRVHAQRCWSSPQTSLRARSRS